MKRRTDKPSGQKRKLTWVKKNRRPKIWLSQEAAKRWRHTIQVCQKTEILILERAVKDAELIFANFMSEETMVLHRVDRIAMILTPYALLTRARVSENENATRVCLRLNVSSETFARAENLARNVELPTNIVFVIAMDIAALWLDTLFVELFVYKDSDSPLFLEPE